MERKQTLKRSHSENKEIFQVENVNLNLDQKLVISRLLKQLSHEGQSDIHTTLQKPNIQQIFQDEFNMNGSEIKNLESQIAQKFKDIMKNGNINKDILTSFSQISQNPLKSIQSFHHKPKPLTMFQRREFDHYEELQYNQFPAQPCVRSLYYISKIAQTQRINIIVPPTILIGFGDDNRMMYNDHQTGLIIVQHGYISPKIINNFIQKNMVTQHEEQSIEDKLIFPKFVIRISSRFNNKNEIKLYYNKDSLIADIMNFWGSFDIAVQLFIKQKHLRPSILRYYLKNGHVYRSCAINNQENLQKESRLYQSLLQLIADQQSKLKRPKLQTTEKPTIDLLQKRREGIKKSIADFLTAAEGQELLFNGGELILDKNGFPTSLSQFKINDYYREIQTSISNNELKRYFTISADNVENLSMMNCRPGAQPQAEQATMDLFRLFSQYYLKTQKFGNISHFVCDFMEGENGLLYLLQVKSFECEGLLHDWQIPFQPKKTLADQSPNSANRFEDDQEFQHQICQAKIICQKNQFTEEQRELFIECCKNAELWSFNSLKKGQIPKCSSKIIKKYHKEIQMGKESFLFQSEKQRICPLFPLTTFCEQQKTQINSQNNTARKSRQSKYVVLNSVQREQLDQQFNQNQQENEQLGNIISEDQELTCCYGCYKILELFTSRYYSLVFKSENTVEELRKLKLKLVNNWTKENFEFLLNIYKTSKKALCIVGDIEQLERKNQQRLIKERTKTPESLIRKSIKKNPTISDLKVYNNQEILEQTKHLNKSQSEAQTLQIPNSLHKSIDQLVSNINDQISSNPSYQPPILPQKNNSFIKQFIQSYSSQQQRPKTRQALSASQYQSQRIQKREIDNSKQQTKRNQSLLQVSDLGISERQYLSSQGLRLSNAKEDEFSQNLENPYQNIQNTAQNLGQKSINDKELQDLSMNYSLKLIGKSTTVDTNKEEQRSGYYISSKSQYLINQSYKSYKNTVSSGSEKQLFNIKQNTNLKMSQQVSSIRQQDKTVNEYFTKKRQLNRDSQKLSQQLPKVKVQIEQNKNMEQSLSNKSL